MSSKALYKSTYLYLYLYLSDATITHRVVVRVESVDECANMIAVNDVTLRSDVVTHDGEQSGAEDLQTVRSAQT